jgi:outer membrane protein OmpA-like peptidoglycan-associated protein
MKLRSVAPAVGVVVLLMLGGFCWAWFSPDPACADPSCARQRFTLDLELDRFERVDPIALQISSSEGDVSVSSVIGSGGIDVRLRSEERGLPLAINESLDRADLYAYAQEWRSATAHPDADAHLYAMLAPAIVSDSGEELFGLMFDTSDRTGFAVAPAEIRRRFIEHEADSIPLLQLRTFIHEMLHALNRRHAQAAQMPGERLTIEAPTRCIADNTGRQHWTLRERPLMSLSPSTIEFFQSAPAVRVLPGRGNSPFLVGSPSTCSDVRASIALPPENSRWREATRRFRGLVGFPQAQAAETNNDPESDISAPSDVEVALQAMPAGYPLGYPVAIRVTAINKGQRTLPLVGRLTPGYGLLTVDVRAGPDENWDPIEPIAWYEPINDEAAMLAPGARTEQTVPIFFDKDAWTFPAAGSYEVRARLSLGDDVEPVVTDPIVLQIEDPDAEADREALRLISDPDGRLRNDIGRQLLMQGRGRDPQVDAVIRKLVDEYSGTALGVSMQLTRASGLLRNPIDPKTGKRPPPDLAGARELLADSCSDSGVAALRGQLLDFHEDTTGSQPAPAMEEPLEAAWEGSVPKGSSQIATYSDASLQVAPLIFHFCPEETELRAEGVNSAVKLGRELRRLKSERIVLVGHSDRSGTCRSNDAAAMRRAEAVRTALVRSGLDRRRIDIVSLGKRRPKDFSSLADADALNRRVEVLVPTAVATALPVGPGDGQCKSGT